MSTRYIADSVRRLVAERANFCCEYCGIAQEDAFFTFQIDHIISLKHGGETTDDNLAYSCFPCNSNKGSDIGTVLLPDVVFIRLFNPRSDNWNAHFKLIQGVFYSDTEIGKATIKVLKLNDRNRVLERQIL